jgi:large subunit ribosomal protein L4
MKLDVVDTKNNSVGSIEVDDSVFAAPVKEHLFWEVVRQQLASRRAGTHKTKRVGEVAGTGKKPYKQKGTGRARHGTMRQVGMRKGAVVHGPQPRDYSYEMPKKMVKGALRSAISLRNNEKALHVIRGWEPKEPKTKAAAAVLKTFGATSTLVVDSSSNIGLWKSLSNMPKAKFLPIEGLNVRDVLAYDHLFISDKVVPLLVEKLKTTPSRKERGESA